MHQGNSWGQASGLIIFGVIGVPVLLVIIVVILMALGVETG